MNKTTQSILLAALMATAGFATAQTTSNPTPAQGGPTVQRPADANTMPATRAEVKSEIDTKSGAKVAAPAQGGGTPSGAAAPAGSGGMSANSRADVKAQAQANNTSKAGASAQGDGTVSGSSKAMATSSTSAERKAARAERKAARAAKRNATANSSGKGMDSGPASPAKTAPQ